MALWRLWSRFCEWMSTETWQEPLNQCDCKIDDRFTKSCELIATLRADHQKQLDDLRAVIAQRTKDEHKSPLPARMQALRSFIGEDDDAA